MSQCGGKLMPNLDQNSTNLLNLTVLQRIDPFIEEILITAAHVTLYEFNIELSQWSRKDVEGSLFVVKRNTQPRFQFIVMNRRNTENLVENLLGDFEYEVQVPYLLYRNAAQEVNGIWFYDARECEEVANLFIRILSAYSKVPSKSKLSSSKSEFEELEAVANLSVMDGPLEATSAIAPNADDVPGDRAFVNFFSSALSLGNSSNPSMVGQPLQSTAVPPLLSRPANAPHMVPSTQAAPAPISSTLSTSFLDNRSDPSNNINQTANLVKPPSFFNAPPTSSPLSVLSQAMATAPPLQPPLNLQRSYGAPVLQPFPPPTPPPSLTPISAPNTNYGAVISRDKVREALLVLVQDNQFIDMVYRAILNSHNS